MPRLRNRLEFGLMFDARAAVIAKPLPTALTFARFAEHQPLEHPRLRLAGLAPPEKSTYRPTAGYDGLTFDDGPTSRAVRVVNTLHDRYGVTVAAPPRFIDTLASRGRPALRGPDQEQIATTKYPYHVIAPKPGKQS